MALSSVDLFIIRPINRHHTRATGSDVRMVHWSQLHACLVIDLTLTDIRTVKDVVIIVKPHQPILLLSYLVFLEIGATLALVPLHLTSLILHQVGLSDVRVTLRVL